MSRKPHVADYQAVAALWNAWNLEHASHPGLAPVPLLQRILRSRGKFVSAMEIQPVLGAGSAFDEISEGKFTDCIVALLATQGLRLDHAFGYLCGPTGERVSVADFLKVARSYASDGPRCERIASELDADGDTWISRADFRAYLPPDHPGSRHGYGTRHMQAVPVTSGAPDPAQSVLSSVAAATGAEGGTVGRRADPSESTVSPLQLRIGFFRLLQGAAYRSFRENYSANSETHRRAWDLPYTIKDFGTFVSATIEFYLSLGVVSGEACIAEFRRLEAMVADEIAALDRRIETWTTIEKTPGMLAAQRVIDEERDGLESDHALFASLVDYLLALRLHDVARDQLDGNPLQAAEVARLRSREVQSEFLQPSTVAGPSGDPAPYLESWNRVIVGALDEKIDGAIMPVRFWYERFMPQLLRCASIMSDADLAAMDATTVAELDTWHADTSRSGSFDNYGSDVRDGFPACSHREKLALRQAWDLTETYLNGLEKRREREEFGRDSGYLSEYVAFIDVSVNRSDVATSEMRLSFPYFIGPAVWCLLHASAEIIEDFPAGRRASAIAGFKTFLASFATMYPCPYCRYHLNRYVVHNREVDMYPVEYLLLGKSPSTREMAVSLDDKLATISADRPNSLRLFLWKLHNAVSSSISRTEPWYHTDQKPLYTSRFWPSMDSELARVHALGQQHIELDRIEGIYGIVKPAATLAILRDELKHALHAGNGEEVEGLIQRAVDGTAALEDAVMATDYLARHYTYDAGKKDAPPHFSPEEEGFALSGMFTER